MRLLERLLQSFEAAKLTPEGVAPPVVLVWTDADGQWLPLMDSLRAALPELYVLGDYQPEAHTGPAIWLRCVVDRALPEVSPAKDKTPIFYLPHVSRQVLRAAGDCPPLLQPLIELQYRGRVWHQSNGRDWTVMAFLVSEDGLGLDIAHDKRTEEAMLRALPLLADVDASTLQGRRLDADDFDRLSVADPVRDLLRWMSGPQVFEAAAKGGRWTSFVNVCKTQFQFDPEKDRAADAGAALKAGGGVWEQVWQRFCEAPRLYPGVANALSAAPANPSGLLTLDYSRDPETNRQEERELREALYEAAGQPEDEARRRVIELEERHGVRRRWVWSDLGEGPWARALDPLVRLAEFSMRPVTGATLADAAQHYADEGWKCDRAAMEALAQFRTTTDAGVMVKVVQALYEPWLTASARAFQSLLEQAGDSYRAGVTPIEGEPDVCLLFVDGLRFDVGGWLAEKLEGRSLIVKLRHRLAALPTVTATAKPTVTPIAGEIRGESGERFTPTLQGKPATAPVLRAGMAEAGVDVLPADELPFPSGGETGGWAECGKIDTLGHKVDGELAHYLEAEVDRIADRVADLLNAGWKKVRIVTDHGWLMLPDGLPKIELPHYLTETKWTRCAVFKAHGESEMPTFGWHWDQHVRIVSPHRIGSFRAGETYSHGGISPQECVVPEIVVESGVEAVSASITAVTWRGMRCRVKVSASDPGIRIDLRSNWKQPDSSIVAGVKEAGSDSEVSLVVIDDSHEGAAATVVLLDSADNVLDRKATTVGED